MPRRRGNITKPNPTKEYALSAAQRKVAEGRLAQQERDRLFEDLYREHGYEQPMLAIIANAYLTGELSQFQIGEDAVEKAIKRRPQIRNEAAA